MQYYTNYEILHSMTMSNFCYILGESWEQTWTGQRVKDLKRKVVDLNNQYLMKKGIIIGSKFKVKKLALGQVKTKGPIEWGGQQSTVVCILASGDKIMRQKIR